MNWTPWKKRQRCEQQLHSELQFHLENQVDHYLQQGFSKEEALLRARRDFGNLELTKEQCRDQRAFEPLNHLFRDIRQAAHSLRRSPQYTAAAILTLALGIGATTAMFSAVHGVLLKPLPYAEPDRLVLIALYNQSLKHGTDLSYPDFLDWQRSTRSLKQIAAFEPFGFDLTHPGSPVHVNGYQISSNFFQTLGVDLALGRSFSANEDRIGGMPAAVISNRFWRERFHASRTALGQSITLNGVGYTIVGILPPEFRFEEQPADVYTPLAQGEPLFRNDRTVHDLLCIARLANGVTIGQARAEMNTIQRRIDDLNPTTEKGQDVDIVPLKQELVGDVSQTLLLLLGAVGFVLLIACANVANLLLARSAVRAREFAVRRAFGASRIQIVQHMLTESVVVSLVGGLLGLAVANWGLRAALAAVPDALPRAGNIALNTTVLLFAFAISTFVGVLFSIVPALKHAHSNLQFALRAGGRSSTGTHQRTQRTLVVVQIALALVLLSGAGLLFRTIQNLWAVNPGFNPQHVITFRVGFASSPAAATRAAYQQLTDRIRQIPGIQAAGITALLPLGVGDNSGPFWVGTHKPTLSMAQIPRALYYPTGPGYPAAMQIALLRGRFLQESDTVHSPVVVLIDTLLAKTYFPNQNPLGQTITIPHWGTDRNVPARIVGVVGHVEQYGIDGSGGEKPEIYFSLYQLPDEALPVFRNEVTFAVRTSLIPARAIQVIKNITYGTGDQNPIYDIRTMPDLFVHSMSRQRLPIVLLFAFAALAFFLSSIGIYGVVSYATAQRTSEIGVRIALGATHWQVMQMLIRQGLWLALTGISFGIAASLLLTRVLSSFSHLLYRVPATDPFTLASVSFCLLFSALVACYIPARRASRLDPMTALRQE